MTIEQTKPRSVYMIATTGPYALRDSGGNSWPYVAGGVLASVIKDGVIANLVAGTDFNVAPTSGTDGNLTLTAGALATHAGGQLIITRQTPQEQAWQAVQGPREVGLAAQLDRAMMIIQEQQVALDGALRVPVIARLPDAVLTPGHVVFFGASGFQDGPAPDDIVHAAQNAAIATEQAGIAVEAAQEALVSENATSASETAAATSAINAQSSAASAASSLTNLTAAIASGITAARVENGDLIMSYNGAAIQGVALVNGDLVITYQE